MFSSRGRQKQRAGQAKDAATKITNLTSIPIDLPLLRLWLSRAVGSGYPVTCAEDCLTHMLSIIAQLEILPARHSASAHRGPSHLIPV